MDTNPLPYNVEVETSSGHYTYVVRFTPLGQYCVESIGEYLEQFEKWVYGREFTEDGVEHYHLVIYTELEINKMRQTIKNFIYPFFPDRKRGFGNKQYNLQYAENPRKAISYCLKDLGDFNFSGFTDECIECLRNESFPRTTFEDDVLQLNKDYQNNLLTDQDYLVGYYKIYAKYGRSLNVNTINGYLLSARVLRDPDYAIVLANNNLRTL